MTPLYVEDLARQRRSYQIARRRRILRTLVILGSCAMVAIAGRGALV